MTVNLLHLNIQHWRFEDGNTCPNPGSKWESPPSPRGWYCWVYPSDDRKYEKWMKKHCPSAEIAHRFNSGDPMYTTYIKDDKEVLMFMLKWKVK